MKSHVLSILFLTFSIVSFSQETSYGVRIGLNNSNLDFDPDATFSNQHRNGFAFGGFVDYGISDTVSIQLELQFSAEGAKVDEFRANYLQLPVMARFALSERLTIGAGPMISLKTWKDRDSLSTFTFSGVGGLEYMITDELFLDARIHYGLSNILDEDTTSLEAQNTSFQFGFGIRI